MSNIATMPATHVPGVRIFMGKAWLPVTPPGTRPRNVAVTGTTPRTRNYVVAIPTVSATGYPEWLLSNYPPRPARAAYVPRHAKAA